jgi:hypothetical protein
VCLATILWRSEKGCGVVVLETGEMAFVCRELMKDFQEKTILDVVYEESNEGLLVTEIKEELKSQPT